MRHERLARYTETQFREVFVEKLKKLTEDKHPVDKPTAPLLGGQPGSGKTTLHDIVVLRDRNTIIINADEFREHHPNIVALSEKYRDTVPYTYQFSGEMTEALIDRLSDERYNLVIEGTLRTAEIPERNAALLKGKGYTVELYVMAATAEQSWQGTISRYKEMKRMGITPRATQKDFHDMVVSVLPDNLGKLYEGKSFDRIRLYTRKKECIYDSEATPSINPKSIIEAILITTL